MTAAVAWLAEDDEKATRELEALIERDLTVSDPDRELSQDDAAIDALASQYLGWMAAQDAELRRYTQARDAEIAAIARRYALCMAPHEKHRKLCENAVIALAQRADFGKKKSRKVGRGEYGSRIYPARIEISDAEAALAFVKQHDPSHVKVRESIGVAEVKAFYFQYGALPDGCIEIPKVITWYARPEVDA